MVDTISHGIDDILVVNENSNIKNLDTNLLQDTSRQNTSLQTDVVDTKQQFNQTTTTSHTEQQTSQKIVNFYKRLCFFLFIFLIPIVLVLCVCLRPNFQSIIYIIFLFFLPFLYPINEKHVTGRLKIYTICLIVLSCLSLTAQIVFRIVVISTNSDIIKPCSFKQQILQEFGFNLFHEAYAIDVLRIIAPDVLLLIIASITYSINKKYLDLLIELKRQLIYKNPRQSTRDTTFTDHFCPLKNVNDLTRTPPMSPTTSRQNVESMFKNKKRTGKIVKFSKLMLTYINQIIFLCLLFSCSSIWPCVLSIPYFFSFIFLVTKWSITGRLRGSNPQFYTKIFFIFYSALHVLVIYIYQIDLFQTLIVPDSFVARLIGFNQIVYTKCDDPGHIYLNSKLTWMQFVQPFLIFLLYWLLSVELSYGLEKLTRSNPSLGFSPEINIDKTIESENEKLSDIDENTTEKQIEHFIDDSCPSLTNEQDSSLVDYDDKKLIQREKRLFEPSTDQPTTSANLQLKKLSLATTPSSSDVSSTRRRHKDKLKRRRQTAIIFDYTRTYVITTFKFLNKQSYLLSLVSMMAWSILYHSILTLVLLLWACLIWILPRSRQWCLRSSPLFVFYSISLIALEFIYGLQLGSKELPEFKEIGLVRHEIPFLNLATKVGLTLFYWLTLNQYITERREETILNIPTTSTGSNYLFSEKFQAEIVEWIQSIFAKYWIFLSSLMLLLMSCQNVVVAYRIGYMGLFLYFITTFQLMHSFWRMSLYIFNFIVIVYSMIVLLLIYLFQFEEVPIYFKRVLHIDDAVLASIGFEKFDKKDELVLRLLTPTTFLIVNIIQNHYFHEPWMKLTKPQYTIPNETSINNNDTIISHLEVEIRPNTNKKENFLTFFKRNLKTVNEYYSRVSVYLWRLAEIHVYKLLIGAIGVYCLYDISLLNFVLLVSVLFCLVIDNQYGGESKISTIFLGFVQIWVSVITLASMIYQLQVFEQSPLRSNCTFSNTSSVDPFLLREQDNLKYIGIEKLKKYEEIMYYLKPYIVIFLVLTFYKIVNLKQKHYRLRKNKIQPFYSVLFEDITWSDMDKDCIQFIKYIFNYFFYRFGLEICFFVTTINIITRMDAYAILYGVWLGLFLNLKRTTISKIWPVYFLFLIVLIPIQYIGCLGLPPVLCYQYPWSKWNTLEPLNILNKLRFWLYLPDYSNPPEEYKLLADFFQVYFVWLQLNVFNLELDKNPTISKEQIETFGGKNNELVYENRNVLHANPFHDFISTTRNYLDKLKYGVYMYSYWIVLAIVFLTGTSRISVLCMGYVILSFMFLWMGQTYLTRPLDKLLRFWNVLVSYCFTVIFIKAILQVVFCIFSGKIHPKVFCLLIDIFGIDCQALPEDRFPKRTCTKDGIKEDVGLVWDALCFLVLLLQKRLYMSSMFEHVVNEYKAQALLAARGAEIFKKIISHKVAKEKEKENRILEKLKANVERIRRHQTTDANQEPQEHYGAVRSGDYYMFDEEFDLEDTDVDVHEPTEIESSRKNSSENFQLSTSSSNYSDELKIQTSPDTKTDKKQSWLTIENKKLLSIKFYFKKYFLILFDLTLFYIDKHSKDFRLVSDMLVKEKLKLKLSNPTTLAEGSVTDQDIAHALQELNNYIHSQSRLDKFLSAIFYFALSQSEFICYFFMILNHLRSASLLSVPLPISIFLWAMLCLPRPTKKFWISCITYIETIVVIKYLFQFKFFPWNQSLDRNDWLDNLLFHLGIQKKEDFAVFDLFALLVIFLHRTVLKRLGLWKDYSGDEDDEEMITLKLEKIEEDLEKNAELDEQVLEEKNEENIEDEYDDETRDEIDHVDVHESEEIEHGDEEGGLNGLKTKALLVKKHKSTNPFIKFYREIESKHYAVVVDCYAKLFLCDFINCIITIFTYQYFGESAYLSTADSDSVVSSIKDNKVPYSFLIMFLIQFVLMIVDRALYLRKNRVGKFLFQLVLVLFVHIWVFFVLPFITKLRFVDNTAVQVWYFVKCIYFGYSSRQIRCGYPTRILGNFLTKSYSYVNLVLFKAFLLVPFLLELRSLMDWMFTDTSLSLSDWLQVEDIYANIFVLKCFRYNENKFPTPRGTKRRAIIKYGFGGLLLTIIILIIWFPLLLFSFSEGFNRTVPPQTCKFELQLAGFLQIYSMSSQQRLQTQFTKQQYEDLKHKAPAAYTFLKDYSPEDIYCIAIPGNSTSNWQISPPSFSNLKEQLDDSSGPVELNFFYSVTRESSGMKNEQLSEVVTASKQTMLYNETKTALYKLLNDDKDVDWVEIKSVYPRFVHARPKGNLIEIESMKNTSSFQYYVDIRVSLQNKSNNLWWDAFDTTQDDYKSPCSKPGYLTIIIISDKVSPSSIRFITEQGIIGIYITFVLALSRFIRIMVVNSSIRIMFEQLPYVDRILKLVKSVYLVRENKQFLLEEELYSKIIFLYRSTETMIKYTRPPNRQRLQIENEEKKNL